MNNPDPLDFCTGLGHEFYEVTCARCAAVGTSETFIVEEGDEWECPPCNELWNAREAGGQP